MKKLLCVVLVYTVALSMLVVGAGGAEAVSTSDVVGVWRLQAVEAQGVSVDPATVGMEMLMTLGEDGTALLEMTGEESEAGAWVLEGDKVLIADEVGTQQDFSFVEGMLKAEMDGMSMIFAKDVEEVESAETVPAA